MDAKTVVEPIRILGDTIGFWTQNSILFFSALIAIRVISASSKQERIRATIDVVMDQRNDPDWLDSRKLITKMHEDGERNLAKFLEHRDGPEFKAILKTLNSYEFVCSGIRAKAFDEATFKRIRYSTVLKDWEAMNPFVLEFRRINSRPTLFQDFQWISEKWKKESLKADFK